MCRNLDYIPFSESDFFTATPFIDAAILEHATVNKICMFSILPFPTGWLHCDSETEPTQCCCLSTGLTRGRSPHSDLFVRDFSR